jgi:hypothetical protein
MPPERDADGNITACADDGTRDPQLPQVSAPLFSAGHEQFRACGGISE